jgi:hypothetical protein
MVVIGCTVIVLGLFYNMSLNLTALCTELLQPPGTPSRGCGWDFAPLILPATVGGALIVAGTWTYWTFKPKAGKLPPTAPNAAP